MGTRTWNGLDKLSASDVLSLCEPDAERWYRETLDPNLTTCPGDDLDELSKSIAATFAYELAPVDPRDSREQVVAAIRYAAECFVRRFWSARDQKITAG